MSINSPTSLVSKNLAYLRRTKTPCLSKSRLATSLGIDRRTYSNYERGAHEPPHWFVVKASQYFGVSIDDITSKNLGGDTIDNKEAVVPRNRTAQNESDR